MSSNKTPMKLGTKMNLAFGLLMLLMLVLAGSGYRSLVTMRDINVDMTNDKLPKVLIANDWEVAMLNSARHMRNALITDGQEAVNKELAGIADDRIKRKDYVDLLEKSVTSESGKTSLKLATDARTEYMLSEEQFMKLAAGGDLATAKKVMLEQARPKEVKVEDAIEQFIRSQKGQVEMSNATAISTFEHDRNLTIGLIILSLAVGAAAAWSVTRSVARQLGGEPAAATDLARAVANGDLSVTVDLKPGDTTSLMAQLSEMQGSLSRVVSNVRQNSESVAIASAQIAQGNQDLSGRTEQQASALEETAASMEQLSTTVKQNADNALQANQLATNASSVAVQGGAVVAQVVETMKGINESSRRISDIIGVIDGIAFQTNILALNAAVEAARAGEQGRGFAVVASEVRSLAQRSADAAKEIKALISASVERVEEGTGLVDKAGTTMDAVVASIKRVTDIMGEIAAASREQSSGVAQVGEAVMQMDRATQQNAALVEESAAAADSLKSQAQQLVSAVAIFKLTQGGAPLAPVARAAPAPAPVRAAVRAPLAKVVKGNFAPRPKPAAKAVETAAAVRPKAVELASASGASDTWESF
jgi:methyl-accepting chemotaxis protein